ncbi:unnamed protein product [Calypogeia fissa]
MAPVTESSGPFPRHLTRLEKLVWDVEQMTPKICPQVIDQFRDCLANLPLNLTPDEGLQVWQLSYSIWNSCVTVANTLPPGGKLDDDHARLRQIACDLLFLARNVDGIESGHFKVSTFFYKTGVIWHSLKRFEQAAICFEKGTELMSKAHGDHERNAAPRSKEEQELMFELFVARSKTAWELSQRALASSLSARARGLLSLLPERSAQLAEHYLEFGQSLLSKPDAESQTDAIKYLEQAFEIISSTPAAVNSGSTSESDPAGSEASLIPDLKTKILRYLAGAHLQRENYESVLKCLAVLKLAPTHHPSTSYFALKALAGLGRYEEAEKELIALVHDNDANAEVCMSGIEIVTQDPNRLDAAKRAFLALHARFPSDKSLPVRILECLLRRHLPHLEPVINVKALDAVFEIASNEGVVTTITGIDHDEGMLENDNSVSKEQECIHALLWNSGSELFQAKQYETCIKLFETSMLYLPRDPGSNLQRAKSFRVLCLCRLALMQYDRALEYVTEAEKVDPNIACTFLKFKIHLQTKNEAAAAEQVEKMTSCSDFESEYLVLASHEALTCSSTTTAISALLMYLNLPQEQRTAGTRDVVVIRNIVSLALQDEPLHRSVVVKYLKEAQSRLKDIGLDAFFGLGNVGQQEANWFAVTSWNQGLAAVKKTLGWQLAGDYFSCAADFYASLPDTAENLRCLEQSLLLATSSLLASTSGDECLRSASRMLERCSKVHRALAMSTDPTNVTKDSSEIHLSLLRFELKNRAKDYKSQIEILHHCASLPGFQANYFLHMAEQANKTPGPGDEGNEVISTAYRLGLKSFLASPSPDYKLVAMIVRKLITLADQHCKDGPGVMAVYKHAKEILAGLDSDEYPREELQWLVATSWNRAGLQVKFLRFSVAEPWMKLAIDLANYDPRMENRKLSMIDTLKEVRQNTGNQSPMANGDL